MASPRADVEKVRSCLRRLLRVQLTDGRVVEGTLDCYDNLGNMILSNTIDVSNKSKSQRAHRIGLVLVPGHAQVTVYGLRDDDHRSAAVLAERVSLLSVHPEDTDSSQSIL